MIPTRDQILLLRASLLSGGDASAAWKTWRKHINFEDIDAGSYRLMPLVYKNLRRENIEDELLGRLKGIYRHTWSRNQLLFHDAAQVMAAMQDAGISVLVLKGATLANSYYSDAGLRPMADFDFMVPLGELSRAFEVMKACGWHYIETVPLQQLVWASHAEKWKNRNVQHIDLHWSLLADERQSGSDDEVWPHAAKIEFSGRCYRAMCETDLLWHVCIHGAVADEIPTIRWVADAWTILQCKRDTIDWERLVKTMQQRHLTLVIARAFSFLRAEFNAPVPTSVIEELNRSPASWVERWENRIKAGPRGILGALPLHCMNYLRLTKNDRPWHRIAGVPLYFQRVWGSPSMRGVLFYIVKKAAKRLASTK